MIHYSIHFPEPHRHHAEVKLQLNGFKGDVHLYMPVWTPGSYLVREFSKHIESWKCNAPAEKTGKNRWKIKAEGDPVEFCYCVYAFELTVRTCYVDHEQAFINGAGIFMAVEGHEQKPIHITLHPDPSWKEISTALSPVKNDRWKRMASNYDELVDSPILIGNHKVLSFLAGNIPHEVAIVGESNMQEKEFISHLQAICEEETRFWGSHPCEKYLFFIHHTEKLRGGLEHMNCSSNVIPRFSYVKGDDYNSAMSLLSHEYFHLWNGKRIRPVELSEFDYNSENYTRLLWVVEGITSYYDDLLCYRAGVETREEYLKIVAKNLSEVVNRGGNSVQSLTDSSFDTWIKYYRPNENTVNSQVNYYTKGAAVAVVLNTIILHSTKGKKCLDHVMRELFELYKKRPTKGYTEEQVLKIFESVAGIRLKAFFDQHIYGTAPIDLAAHFNLLGLELKDKKAGKKTNYLGWKLEKSDGQFIVKHVEKDYGAARSGVYANDEILAIDGFRISDDWEKRITNKKGSSIKVLLSRQGKVCTVPVELTQDSRVEYEIVPKADATEEQKMLFEIWLRT